MIVRVEDWFQHVDRLVSGNDFFEVTYVRTLSHRQAELAQDNGHDASAAAWLAVEAYAQEAIYELRAERQRVAEVTA